MHGVKEQQATSKTSDLPPGRVLLLRRDLQGVRGLGIILVVIGHLWRWPPGVYAMLDMFFVLSGYLITAILIKALTKYGPPFLLVFALNRVRRLMPAAATVILATIGLTYLIYSTARGDRVAEDGMWALLLVVNWHFALSGADYFQDDRAASPLIHYWSLSIEEQFYAIWPVIILMLIVAAARSRRVTQTTSLALGISTLTLAAFAYSMWHSVQSPTTAYFSTLDRTWEFGIGGLIAVFAIRLAKLPTWSAIVLSWGGVVGLFVTMWLLPYGVPFPAPYGLFPALLTAAIIVGGLGRDTSYIPLIDNRAMIYVGDLSYSIYLCHLPVNVMLLPFFANKGAPYFVTAIALTIAASTACYYLIERPFRDAGWLMTTPERTRQHKAGTLTDWSRVRDRWLAVLATAAVAMVAAVILQPGPAPSPSMSYARPDSPASRTPMEGWTEPERLQATMVKNALSRNNFPDFDTSLSELTFEAWMDDVSSTACLDVTDVNMADCRFGEADAKSQAVVLGDSFAMAWMPGIEQALIPRGWSVQQLTTGQCTTWTLPGYRTMQNQPHPSCAEQHERAIAYLKLTKPDLLILASAPDHVRNSERDDITDDQVRLARTGLSATLRLLAPHVGRVVVLGPQPTRGDLSTCVTRVAGPDLCDTEPSDYWYAHVAGERSAAKTFRAHYINTERWFCDDDGYCPAFIGNTPVLQAGHLTVDMSEDLAPLLADDLLRHIGRTQKNRYGA